MLCAAPALSETVTPRMFPSSGGTASISYKGSGGLRATCKFEHGVETVGATEEDSGKSRLMMEELYFCLWTLEYDQLGQI